MNFEVCDKYFQSSDDAKEIFKQINYLGLWNAELKFALTWRKETIWSLIFIFIFATVERIWQVESNICADAQHFVFMITTIELRDSQNRASTLIKRFFPSDTTL